MAGESPDRSKQHESSAEPTSGSAGPVPGARSEARDARDPRLTVAGEPGDSGTSSGTSSGTPSGRSSGTSESRGGVDTATRVLSVRGVVTESDEPGKSDGSGKPRGGADGGAEDKSEDEGKGNGNGSEPAEEVEESAGAGAADSGAEDGEEGAGEGEQEAAGERAATSGDTRLRAAVAAWVDAEDAADAKDADEGVEAAEAAGDAEPEGKTGKDTPDNQDGEDGKRSEPEADGEVAKAPEAGDPKAPEAEPDDGSKPESEPEAEAPGARTPAGPPVDQPTAVFKTPRPAVDQPTTLLKLGGAPKTGTKSDAKGGTKGAAKSDAKSDAKDGPKGDAKSTPKPAPGSRAAESEAERTSKFVALKPLDDAPKAAPTAPTASTASTAQAAPTAPAVTPTPTARNHRPGFEPTTQQPLPPKPPLDLLAELTNTPPPPQTPLRTTVRRVKIWTPLVLLLVVIFAVVQALRPLPSPALALTAKDTFTFDGTKLTLPWPNEGQGWMDVDGVDTMDHFGEQKPVAIGSVAKTMTAYIILRDHPLKVGQEGPKITIDPQAEKEGGYDKTGDESTLNTVKAGQTLTEKQALSAVMIPSANNIARLLARWDAGSEAAFVKKMNATAKELGMANTTYTDPSGLTKTTVSTAEDQVKLGDQVVKNPALVAITSAASWTDPSGKNWPNWNELPYRMGAIGIKTGSTTAAGGNLLFAARKKVGGQTVTVVGAILGQRKSPILTTVNNVSKTALQAAKEALASAKILKKGDVVGYVDDQLGGHTPVVVTEDVTAVGWAGSKVKVSFAPDQVPHSAKAGAKVGTLTVGDGGASGAVKVPVALQKDLSEPGFTDKLTRLG
ncbi:D-alanyl-D-alanine carboxypeptidase [Streptomyces sp. NPDC021356]|uniref:D-alanyl-D-alanine carboxypeptidase n=1 Tax=Streptomyces sp. NPDC021356 TaxID=3154900 RepID=UPI0033D98B57